MTIMTYYEMAETSVKLEYTTLLASVFDPISKTNCYALHWTVSKKQGNIECYISKITNAN